MSLEENVHRFNSESIIEIYGLGYVGFPLAVRLASSGIKTVGIDTNSERISRLGKNELMDSEIYLKDKFIESRNKNYLELKTVPEKREKFKVGIICVPTPIPKKDSRSDVYVISAVETFLGQAKTGDIIILESSIEVGTTERISSLIESKGFQVGKDFGLCFCPERIDPANKEWGIENIPRIIYCSDDSSFEIAKRIYNNVNQGNLLRVSSSKTAEIVKSFENTFRLVNIALVNELAILCDKLGVNVKEIIDAAATKPFGFMPHYPGAGAGGHCIPKDPRFLLESARKLETKFDTIEDALKINEFMPKYIVNSIEKTINELKMKKTILVCGLSYKPNVEDMRDSPSFKIIQELKAKEFTIYGFDPFFNSDLTEKYLIENHISELNFIEIKELNDETIKKINCMCIVQHHDENKSRIKEIYEKSLIPFIYDCQSKLQQKSKSNCKLEFLGN
jgi:UDP-N-acetyl-D-glucosamine dehydrogenase